MQNGKTRQQNPSKKRCELPRLETYGNMKIVTGEVGNMDGKDGRRNGRGRSEINRALAVAQVSSDLVARRRIIPGSPRFSLAASTQISEKHGAKTGTRSNAQ